VTDESGSSLPRIRDVAIDPDGKRVLVDRDFDPNLDLFSTVAPRLST